MYHYLGEYQQVNAMGIALPAVCCQSMLWVSESTSRLLSLAVTKVAKHNPAIMRDQWRRYDMASWSVCIVYRFCRAMTMAIGVLLLIVCSNITAGTRPSCRVYTT